MSMTFIRRNNDVAIEMKNYSTQDEKLFKVSTLDRAVHGINNNNTLRTLRINSDSFQWKLNSDIVMEAVA
ncbi:CLUMA_CG012434, isoform A [Clunio marinus]|uniref:CLUMA_CG012434, isoform A n=1 Tax=Clunio marinus TaxID=568069 RepID=A0A1J1IEM5_9DIPT|nr:CLUMA_CG012434, isoform A [Clunio marinus]